MVAGRASSRVTSTIGATSSQSPSGIPERAAETRLAAFWSSSLGIRSATDGLVAPEPMGSPAARNSPELERVLISARRPPKSLVWFRHGAPVTRAGLDAAARGLLGRRRAVDV